MNNYRAERAGEAPGVGNLHGGLINLSTACSTAGCGPRRARPVGRVVDERRARLWQCRGGRRRRNVDPRLRAFPGTHNGALVVNDSYA